MIRNQQQMDSYKQEQRARLRAGEKRRVTFEGRFVGEFWPPRIALEQAEALVGSGAQFATVGDRHVIYTGANGTAHVTWT